MPAKKPPADEPDDQTVEPEGVAEPVAPEEPVLERPVEDVPFTPEVETAPPVLSIRQCDNCRSSDHMILELHDDGSALVECRTCHNEWVEEPEPIS